MATDVFPSPTEDVSFDMARDQGDLKDHLCPQVLAWEIKSQDKALLTVPSKQLIW